MAKHQATSHRRPNPQQGLWADSPADAQRRVALRRHKAFVTALLVLAAVIFLATSWWQDHSSEATPAWVGFVRAAAEAGMVGGLADWFAVTALFRHPMGLPIPHTALIPRKKDQLGQALSQFVGENFLNPELITEKVASVEIPMKAGQWLAKKEHAEKVSAEAGRLLGNSLRALDPKDAEALLKGVVVDKLAQPQWGPPLGRILGELIEDGKLDPLIEELLAWADRKVGDSEELIVAMVDARKPVWAPRFLNHLVGEKIYRELVKWIGEVRAQPDHGARLALRRFLRELAEDLQHDPDMIERVEGLKAELMASRPVQAAPAAIWASASSTLIAAAGDPESLLRRKITELATEWSEKLLSDAPLRDRLNRRITGTAAFLANNYSAEVTSIISETVESWDATEASEKIELMVGKDLQFIRLNGTIVGALAGLAIYTVSQVLF